MDVLENTLWNRQLGIMSEEIVAALVCQIYEGELSGVPINHELVVKVHVGAAGNCSCVITAFCSSFA